MDQQGLKHGQLSQLCTLGVGHPKIHGLRYHPIAIAGMDPRLLEESGWQAQGISLSKFAPLEGQTFPKNITNITSWTMKIWLIWYSDQVVFWKTRPQEVKHVVSTMVGLRPQKHRGMRACISGCLEFLIDFKPLRFTVPFRRVQPVNPPILNGKIVDFLSLKLH